MAITVRYREEIRKYDSPSDKLKKTLSVVIAQLIKQKFLNNNEAAAFLKINQTRISLLMNGHIEKFTVDFLLNLLCKLDYDMSINNQMPSSISLSINEKH